MQHLYFCRHGQSLINVNDVFATKPGTMNDLGLTELGRQQAAQGGKATVAQKLRIDLIVCSPLKRAQETAGIIADKIGYDLTKIVVWDDLKELQFGALEGTPWNSAWDTGFTYAKLDETDGAETIAVMQQRAARVFAKLKREPYDNILVVSHSAFGRALKRVIEGRPYTDEFKHEPSLPFATPLQYT